ncbi:fumarylacetoacetate hydrolase family protein [Planctomicrobium sp. SH661]|uniref:fumarylacetoacetate hydrolase family protein n=1 Tax=Planctomicrobium sp. SH661 TaxID=3448124 RepID=UPI003F5C2CB2
MQLIRFGSFGREQTGVLLKDGRRKDVSASIPAYDRDFFNQNGLQKLAELLKDVEKLPDVPADARWGAPVARPGKVICIGLNYADHARESGLEPPKEPVIFMKAANTVVGPYDDILIPRKSEKTDWEVELGIIIGKDARYLDSPEDAKNYIAGYCISHDVSERHFQTERGGQWTKGKSCDTFNPLGPTLVTADEVADVNALDMWLTVNGERRQTGNTRTMIFDPYFVVHYLTQFMTLEAGDVISTGTPPGVGLGMKPPQFLKAGDVVALGIQGLGEQQQTCRNA